MNDYWNFCDRNFFDLLKKNAVAETIPGNPGLNILEGFNVLGQVSSNRNKTVQEIKSILYKLCHMLPNRLELGILEIKKSEMK